MMRTQRPAPVFVGGHVALDFLNSVAAPRNTEFDWLETGPDLLDWLVSAQLFAEPEIAHLRAETHRADLTDVTEAVRQLRDEFRDFVHAVCGQAAVPAGHALIDRVNQLLARGVQHLKIEISPKQSATPTDPSQPVTLARVQRCESAQDLLPRVAAVCADLICTADFRYVRNCEGPTCTLYFLDVSKNHKRRWCAMEVCGNRAKAAAHRKRA